MSCYKNTVCKLRPSSIGCEFSVAESDCQHRSFMRYKRTDFCHKHIKSAVKQFKVSRKCVNALINGSKVKAVIDMKPAVDLEDLTVRINTLWNEVSKDKKSAAKPYKDRFRILLTKVLPASLIPGFMRTNPDADHKRLPKALKNWQMEIAGYVGYERCVVTAGGVSLDELTPKTLESKLIPGLHFAGEVIDLDADTGGYNLQTAFSTGYLAGISAAKSL